MKFRAFVAALVLWAGSGAMALAQCPQQLSSHTLVAQTGFESGVSIASWNDGVHAYLTGSDVPGFTWTSSNNLFNMQEANAITNGYVTISIVSTDYHGGSHSLFSTQDREDANNGGGVQNRFEWFGDDVAYNNEICWQFWYKVKNSSVNNVFGNSAQGENPLSGLRETRGPGGWGDPTADFSIIPMCVWEPSSGLMWLSLAGVDYTQSGWDAATTPPYGWIVNYDGQNGRSRVNCPIGSWNSFEMYVKRSPLDANNNSTGIVKIWIAGNLVADVENVRTKHDTNAYFVKIASDMDFYTGIDHLFAHNGWQQWSDDVKVWKHN